jgi:hypothetical protein
LASVTFQRFVAVAGFADALRFAGAVLLAVVVRLAVAGLVDLTFVLDVLIFMVFTFAILIDLTGDASIKGKR